MDDSKRDPTVKSISIDERGLASAGISGKELQLLNAFRSSQEWEVVKKLLKYFRFQSDLALRSPMTTEPWIRHHQGRLGQMNEFANFIETDLAEWYTKRARS